jgi:hypothetical protein
MSGETKRSAFRLMPAPPGVIFFRQEADGDAASDSGRVVKLAGEIKAAGAIADIVGLVAQAGWVGELVVMDGTSARSLFFDGGSVLGAQTNVPTERIGSLLHRQRLLDEQQVRTVAASMGKSQGQEKGKVRRFGDVAVQLGMLSREKLFQTIALQTKEIAFAMLQVADGMLYFLDRFDPGRLASAHRIGATNLLMESLQRMDETSYFRERIPSGDHVPVPVPGRSDPQPELIAVWRACDGERSVLEVARACALIEFEATRALCQLVQTGFLRISAPRPRGSLALLSVFNDAMATIYRFAARAHVVPVVREHLAGFTKSIAVYDGLFAGTRPGADGRFDAATIAANSQRMGGDSDALLAQRLYPYVAFALFATSSLLSKEDERLLTEQVSELIRTLAPNPEAG